MKIDCFRCGKSIEGAGDHNADYVMAADTLEISIEDGQPKDIHKTGLVCPDCWRPDDVVLWGVHKRGKVIIPCAECGAPIENPCVSNADYVLVKPEQEGVFMPVPKAAYICSKCFNPAKHFIIWGIHKPALQE